jgi:SET domain-containing protein
VLTNAHRCARVVREAAGMVRTERYALAVYRRAAMLNHACAPNTAICYAENGEGTRLQVRVSRALEAGQALLHCYGPQRGHMELERRQRVLSAQYFFACRCEACLAGAKEDRLVLALAERGRRLDQRAQQHSQATNGEQLVAAVDCVQRSIALLRQVYGDLSSEVLFEQYKLAWLQERAACVADARTTRQEAGALERTLYGREETNCERVPPQ